MNNLKKLLLTAFAFFSIGISESYSQVSIFEHCNYTGKTATMLEGSYDLDKIAGWITNDVMSSIKVPAGYTVTLYEHAGFKGRTLVVTSDKPCLIDDKFNDIVSSVKVTINPSVAKVTIFEHCDYKGKTASMTEGSYDMDKITGWITNDVMSSIKVPAGYTVTLYEHAGFKGKTLVLTGDKPCLTTDKFNDVVSSMKITLDKK